MIRRFGLFGGVVIVIALVYAIAWGTGSGSSTTATVGAQAAAVTAVTRSCPPPAPNTGTASIAVASAPSGSGAHSGSGAQVGNGSAGSAALTSIPSAATALAGSAAKTSGKAGAKTGAKAGGEAATTVTTPDTAFVGPAPQASQSGATQIDATGTMASGFEAEEATANGTGTVSCAHPGADMWFVGTGQNSGASAIWLDLTNTGSMAATVDVTILTDSGVQDVLNDGITVSGGQYLTVNLAQYVKGSTALAVQVQTSSGQVAANVWEGSGGHGTWLPAADAPSTKLVIPGLTAGSAAKLFVAVPGATDAQVTIEALTARGEFLPFGTQAQDAPAAATSSFPLNSLGVTASALVLTSNVPITAGVLMQGNGIGGFTAPSASVSEQGVVAGNPSGGGNTVGLILSAPTTAVRVSVQVLPTAAERSVAIPQPSLYTVQAAHTLAVTVSPPKGDKDPFAIVVTPQRGSGPLYAARVVMSGSGGLLGELQSVLPVPSAPTAVQLPPAADSYSAVLP